MKLKKFFRKYNKELISVGIFFILIALMFKIIVSFPYFLQEINILVLFATLIILVWYAYDTHRIANQTVESNLRPILLRTGLNINFKFKSIQEKDNLNSFIEIQNLKNVAMDISGYIVTNNKKYNLLFAGQFTDSDSGKTIVFLESYKWQWLPEKSKIFASFDSCKFTTCTSRNEIYLTYKDIEGNSYFTKEDYNYLQITNKL